MLAGRGGVLAGRIAPPRPASSPAAASGILILSAIEAGFPAARRLGQAVTCPSRIMIVTHLACQLLERRAVRASQPLAFKCVHWQYLAGRAHWHAAPASHRQRRPGPGLGLRIRRRLRKLPGRRWQPRTVPPGAQRSDVAARRPAATPLLRLIRSASNSRSRSRVQK